VFAFAGLRTQAEWWALHGDGLYSNCHSRYLCCRWWYFDQEIVSCTTAWVQWKPAFVSMYYICGVISMVCAQELVSSTREKLKIKQHSSLSPVKASRHAVANTW